MPQPFQVSTAVFDPFIEASAAHADELEQIVQRLTQAHVARGSFGYMPASDDLHEAYTEHVNSCLDGLASTAETMQDVSAGASATKQNYESAEEDAVASFQIEG
jgi:hypothetical protein